MTSFKTDDALQFYAKSFSRLHRERKATWPDSTRGGAPHKPLLLLAVLDRFTEGAITHNLVEPDDDLLDGFVLYWSRVVPPPHRGVLALPFFHLRQDGFWHLVPVPGRETIVASGVQIRTMTALRNAVLGARLDEDLFALLVAPEPRAVLRAVLLTTYFSDEARQALETQGAVNVEAFRYSQELLERAKNDGKIAEVPAIITYTRAARSQGFRRIVVTAYERRCAFCGVRVVTADGHSCVDAAHIIPFSISFDDNPRNGLALCRLCHWAFDEGMVTVQQDYRIRASPQLRVRDNSAHFLNAVAGKAISLPQDVDLHPALTNLAFHEAKLFQRR